MSTIAAGLVSTPKDLNKETVQDLGGLLAAMILSKESVTTFGLFKYYQRVTNVTF